jgi:hypothetical protein
VRDEIGEVWSESKQLALLQLGGFFAVVIAFALALLAYVYAPELAAPALPSLGLAFATAVGWYVGKLTATPAALVTLKAVDLMPAAQTAELVERIATTTPPAKLTEIMHSLAPAARAQIQLILDEDEPTPATPPPAPAP